MKFSVYLSLSSSRSPIVIALNLAWLEFYIKFIISFPSGNLYENVMPANGLIGFSWAKREKGRLGMWLTRQFCYAKLDLSFLRDRTDVD